MKNISKQEKIKYNLLELRKEINNNKIIKILINKFNAKVINDSIRISSRIKINSNKNN